MGGGAAGGCTPGPVGAGPVAVAPAPGPGGTLQLSAAKAAALQEVQTALNGARQAQQSGDFAAYGQALQRLDDAMNKFNNTK